MNDISTKNSNKLVQLVILLIPMAFFFHYIETSLFTNASIFAFIGTFIFIVLAGLMSVKSKLSFIFLLNCKFNCNT